MLSSRVSGRVSVVVFVVWAVVAAGVAVGVSAARAADGAEPAGVERLGPGLSGGGATPVELGGVVSKDVPPSAGAADELGERPVSEVVGERTASSESWVLASGARAVRSFAEPKYFRDGRDGFVPIDSTLVADGDREGWLRQGGNAWLARFGPLSEGAWS